MADESILARSASGDADAIASSEDLAVFEERLFRLLERQTAVYTMGDSTSVPVHVAADLLRSVCFVLGFDPEERVVPDRLLAADLERVFRRNLAEVECKVELSGALWREAVGAMPPLPNTALHDTLAAIGDFPRQYDHRSMAHEIPVIFDYPLCYPVPETLLGVDYINEYLRRLLVEFDFLGRFEPDACVRVLERSSPDYVDLLLSLYEPVAANAIARALVGEDPRQLLLSEEERAEAVSRLKPLGEPARGRVLYEAALAACETLGVKERGAREYLCALVPELLPRIEVSIDGDLGGVFV